MYCMLLVLSPLGLAVAQADPRGRTGSEPELEAAVLRWVRTMYRGRVLVAQRVDNELTGRREATELATIATNAGFLPPLGADITCIPRCPVSLFSSLAKDDLLVLLSLRRHSSDSTGSIAMDLVSRTQSGRLWSRHLSVAIRRRVGDWEIGDYYLTSH